MDHRVDNFVKRAEALMNRVQVELDRKPSSRSSALSDSDLMWAMRKISEMKEEAQLQNLPPQNMRVGGLAGLIADQWPLEALQDNELGPAIIEVEKEYLRL